MPNLHLQLKTQYLKIPVVIGRQLWQQIRNFLEQEYPHHSVFVIADSQVADIYGSDVNDQLNSRTGYQGILSFPAGESSKSRHWKATLEDSLLSKKAGRDTVLLALGGGVTGDLVGFVAATLHRGVPLIQLPSSLLAQVDSSIGGKVGINSPAGKNLIGAFYQPAAVFADVELLKTLPQEEFLNGMAEVIKYGAILDDELSNILESEHQKILSKENQVLEHIISRCAQLKIQVVEKDEKESQFRSILNFGHTVGHAIEKLSNFQIKHGFAIASGMRVAARLSNLLVGYPELNVKQLVRLLDLYKLNNIEIGQFSIESIWQTILSDKKSRRQIPRFTLLEECGKPKLFYSVSKEQLERACAVY